MPHPSTHDRDQALRLQDERVELSENNWHVIYTVEDGWELECQHSMCALTLYAAGMQDALRKGEKLARSIRNWDTQTDLS